MKKTLPLFFAASLLLGTPLFSQAADSAQVQHQVQPQMQTTASIDQQSLQHSPVAPAETTPIWVYALLGGSLLTCGLLGVKLISSSKVRMRQRQHIAKLERELEDTRSSLETANAAKTVAAVPPLPTPVVQQQPVATPTSHYASSRMQVIEQDRPLHKQDLAALADEMIENDNLGYLDMLAHGQPMQNERTQQTDLNTLVDKALELMAPLLEQGHVSMEKTLGRLPQLSCRPRLLTQALVDLFRHSLSNLPERSKLSVSTYMYMGQIQISITDNGQGMEIDLPTRGRTTDHTLLSSSKQIVEAHGGTIEVNSQPKVGTEFVITLPIQS